MRPPDMQAIRMTVDMFFDSHMKLHGYLIVLEE
jgi:hypothetical protein